MQVYGVVSRERQTAGSAICVGSMTVARHWSRKVGLWGAAAWRPSIGRRCEAVEIMTMSDTQVAALDHTVQQTNIWLKALGEELHIEDRHVAYNASCLSG